MKPALRPVPGLLHHTTEWLRRAAADLNTWPPACPDAPDPSGVACPSPNEAASSPEPLSPTVVLSQAFLNLLLWDPDNKEFPEVGVWDTALWVVSRTSVGTLLSDSLSSPHRRHC